jgi:hypothetical protein
MVALGMKPEQFRRRLENSIANSMVHLRPQRALLAACLSHILDQARSGFDRCLAHAGSVPRASSRAARSDGAPIQDLPDAEPSGAVRRQVRRAHDAVSVTAGFVGSLASAGVRSPTARFGARMGLKLGAGAVGLTLATSLVPFALQLADSSATAGVEAVSTPALRRAAGEGESLSATLAKFDPLSTASLGEWTRIQRPIAIFALGAQDFAGQTQRYESWRHSQGGRDDRLVYGSFLPVERTETSRPEPHLHLSLQREAGRARSLFLDLVSQGGEAGVSVEKIQQASLITTKFGPVEAADAVFSQGGVRRACLGFRHVSEQPGLRIAGWWCAADGRPADRRQLACLIDRIGLLSAGEDKGLRAAFTQAEKNRDPACNPSRIAQAGRKTSWLDADTAAPALRGQKPPTESARAARKAP